MKWNSTGRSHMLGWCRTAAKTALLFTACGAAIAAGPDTTATVAELSAAYAKLDGFTATYRSEGEGKTLECTLGMDEISGLAALHLAARKGEDVIDSKQWNVPDDDQFFMRSDDELFVFKGVGAELKSLHDLKTLLTAEPVAAKPGAVRLTPFLFLTKTKFSVGLGMTSSDKPSWEDALEDAPIKESDDKTVTFLTEEYGLVTISRESGLLTHLSVTADDGEIRVLELKESHLNPGRQAIEKITTGWSGEGAATKGSVAITAPFRLTTFQEVIDAVDEGKADLGKLETVLGEQEETLRRFADACVSEKGGVIVSSKKWKTLLNKDAMRKVWLGTVPGAKQEDGKGFEEFLASQAVQQAIAKNMAGILLKNENFSAQIMEDIFGKGGWVRVKSTNEAGAAAKQMLEESLLRAYMGALVERKIASLSSERESLD